MEKKQRNLMIIAVILAGIYVCFFTDWVRPPHIQIMVNNRLLPGRKLPPGTPPVSFLLDGKYSLTSVEVTPLDAPSPGGKSGPVWNIVAISNAPVVEAFVYGQPLPGFREAISNARPAELASGGRYRLAVRAGRAHGEVNFRVPAPPAPGS